jgi:WD40 repeat protein
MPTAAPTPDVASITSAVSPAAAGQTAPDAAVYNPDEPGPHPVVLLTAAGTAYSDWNERLPAGWLPASANDTQLVVLIGPEREFSLGSASYDIGPDITAYRYETDLELREACTGQTLATWTFQGSDPLPFPQTAPVDQTRLEGSHLRYTDLESWLCPNVSGQGCWALVHALDGHTAAVESVAFSPDGRTLASGSQDGTIILWNVASGANVQTLDGRTSSVWSVAFSPDGRTLASGSQDNTVILWDPASGDMLHISAGQPASGGVTSAAFSPDGHTLASGSADHTVTLWDAASLTQSRTLGGHL